MRSLVFCPFPSYVSPAISIVKWFLIITICVCAGQHQHPPPAPTAVGVSTMNTR